MTFYNINSFNTWTWNIFPFIFVLFKFFNQHLCFQCTDLLPPWLNLFLGFYSLWCSCRWDCFLNFSDSWFLWGFFCILYTKVFFSCRWYHPYGRKRRGTKEPLDESERGEWKSWLKTQHSENENHGIRSHDYMANRWGNNGNSDKTLCSWVPESLQMVTAAMKLKDTCSLEEKLWPT